MRVIPEFKIPKVHPRVENDKIWRDYRTGQTLFKDEAPTTYDAKDKDGKDCKKVRKTGYRMVWIPKYREQGKRIFKVGIAPQYKDDLLAAYFAAGYKSVDGDAGGPYIVDLDNRRCMHVSGHPCPAWAGTGNRWCSHLLGVAYALTWPYVVGTQYGTIRFLERDGQ